jgi:protein ImuB
MLWLALHLPLLPLEAFCATLPAAQAARPVALLAGHRISLVNPAAAERGLRPGIKRATALALAAELLLAESHPGREAAALQAVAHAALAFTPAVVLHDAQTVLLEVQNSLRLFGGLATLRQRLLAALQALGHHLQLAAAPTALGAALLAQWYPRNRGDLVLGPHATQLPALQALLSQAPVWQLGPGREHWEALQGMGLHTLSDLRALPRTGLARRFGAGLLDELDRALGLQAEAHRWLELPASFESRLELFARADTTEQVLHGASVLLARLVAWAQARHARVAAFTLRMLHEKARHTATPATELRVEMAEPALDAAHLQSLLRERLARLELIAPTLDLQLHCSQLVAGHVPNAELFPTRTSEALGLTRLLERLRARLGDEQVLRLVAVPDHRPEHASRAVPAQGEALTGPAVAATDIVLPLHRPAWLLPEPMPLAEREALPLLNGHPLQLLSGPERIETGWWDDAHVARDYFIALAEDGCLVWVYRGRLPAAPGRQDEPHWYLQGLFA